MLNRLTVTGFGWPEVVKSSETLPAYLVVVLVCRLVAGSLMVA